MRFIYTLIIYLYNAALYLASPFHKKAFLIIRGRKSTYSTLNQISKGENIGDIRLWFHASSLGEFEQGRPLIEAIKEKNPDYKIIISFFSPSGYEIRKNYNLADAVIYLPCDSPKNARKLLDLIKPNLVFFIKYEFWFNIINEIYKRKIPLYQVSLILRPNQYFFSWYGYWFRNQLKKFDYLFVQNSITYSLVKSIGIDRVMISGDTRFDRVNDIAKKSKSFPLIEEFIALGDTLLCGSTWDKDEEIISKAVSNTKSRFKIIIAPHEIDQIRIKSIQDRFSDSILYSNIESYNSKDLQNAKVLIIDSIGILSSIYQYSSIAYIGGGFGSGIHNILEAATFGKPICFGINYKKFKEAHDLISLGSSFSINNDIELVEFIDRLLTNKEFYNKASQSSLNYVRENIGASKKILDNIKIIDSK